MAKFKQDDRIAFYHALTLNDRTKIMFDKMSEAFGDNFVITDKIDLDMFLKMMVKTITTSTEESKILIDTK